MYSIKAISTLTGINSETLRTWERRFEFLEPTRDDSGQRLYSEEDLNKLSKLAALVKAGHPIRHLATKSLEELQELCELPSRVNLHHEEQKLLDDLLGAVQNSDLKRFRFLVGYAASLHQPLNIVEYILSPTWKKIGELWANKTINIATEHALTNIFKEEITVAIRTLHMSATGPSIIFTTPSNELHEIGILMGCYIAASEGCYCHYLGPNLPVEDLMNMANDLKPDAIVLSVVNKKTDDTLERELSLLSRELPKDIELWIGTKLEVKNTKFPFPTRASLFTSYDPFYEKLQCLKRLKRSEISI